MPTPEGVPCITGAIVRGHLEILAAQLGAEAIAAAVEGLPPELRTQMESHIWIPLPAFEAFYAAIAREAGRGVAELHTEISRQSVERTFKTLWRVLLRFTSDEALVSRTPLLFSRGYTKGKLTSVIRTPGVADLELTEWPGVPDIALRGLSVAVETVLRLAGRRSVSISHRRSPQGATLQATWRVEGSSARPPG